MIGKDFDVAKNIKMTEQLQCEMLAVLSEFFTAMQKNASKTEQTEILARLEVLLYLMASRLGISKDAMDRKAAASIKLGLLEEEKEEWKASLLELLHVLEGK
ncbi:MAG: hypothetical protein IKI88_04635 [Anaerotignum sp.]|nr:hypothetical protein [Anaerotignum sp.]